MYIIQQFLYRQKSNYVEKSHTCTDTRKQLEPFVKRHIKTERVTKEFIIIVFETELVNTNFNE